MSRKACSAALPALFAAAACSADARLPDPMFAASIALPTSTPTTATGAIYRAANYDILVASERPRRVGDILTVRLVEHTRGAKSVSADASRSSSTDVTLPGAFPFSKVPADLLQGGTSTGFSGEGGADQSNQLSGEITVTVAEVLPNGVLAVRGEKRIRVARGDEYVRLSGLVRPQDVGFDNSVPSTRVADARIEYAGTGQVAAATRQGWLQRFFTAVSPF